MQLTRHCTLYDNEIRSLKNGVTYQLNGEKPNFNKTCSNILFDINFENKLEHVLFELEKLNREKNKKHIKFYIYIFIGFFIIIGNETYANFMHMNDSFREWEYRITAIGVGISIWTTTYLFFNRFRNKLAVANLEKEKIDDVLDLYNISYDVNFDYKDEIHGTRDVDVIITYKNWKKVNTKSTYTINC